MVQEFSFFLNLFSSLVNNNDKTECRLYLHTNKFLHVFQFDWESSILI